MNVVVTFCATCIATGSHCGDSLFVRILAFRIIISFYYTLLFYKLVQKLIHFGRKMQTNFR